MNWDYIAGFFDGEGSLVRHGKGFRISISQANKEILEEIRDFTGIGHICEITKRKPHWSDSWIYFIAKQSDVYKFVKRAEPRLVLKRKLSREAILTIGKNLKEIEEKRLKLERTIKAAKTLRKKRLSYRAIGKELGIDFGYARRLIKFR